LTVEGSAHFRKDVIADGVGVYLINFNIPAASAGNQPVNKGQLDAKQDQLIAGENITITGSTISAAGGAVLLPGISGAYEIIFRDAEPRGRGSASPPPASPSGAELRASI
jgi:hypothetical protein